MPAQVPWPKTDSLGEPTALRIGSALNCDWLVLGPYTVLGTSPSANLRLDIRLQNASTG